MESHEQVTEGPKVGAILKFLGENVISVGFSGNVFHMDSEVLFLAFTDKLFLDIDIFEAFCCCFLGQVATCAVVVVDKGG